METALSCLNVIIARIIRTLKEICFYIYNNVPSEAPLSSSDNFVIVHLGMILKALVLDTLTVRSNTKA